MKPASPPRMSGPNCLSRDAAKASPITAITANAWSTNKTSFSFSPNAVIPTAPASIANKGRQHGAAKAITRAPTDPMPSSKATVRVRRLILISAKISQSQQSRPRSEECQQWPTPTLDNPSDNSSLCFYPRAAFRFHGLVFSHSRMRCLSLSVLLRVDRSTFSRTPRAGSAETAR